MKQFAEWVVGREYRAGLVAAALALIPLLGIIGSGALVLATLNVAQPQAGVRQQWRPQYCWLQAGLAARRRYPQ